MAAKQYIFLFSFTSLRDTEKARTESLSKKSAYNPHSINWKQLIVLLFCAIFLINGVIFFGAVSSQTNQSLSTSETVSFYEAVVEQYAGQGVVVLRINGTFTSGNPATGQIATSLLVLFDDILVVSLPQDDFSVAFASAILPFNKDDLETILRATGNKNFTIFDTQEIKMFTQRNDL